MEKMAEFLLGPAFCEECHVAHIFIDDRSQSVIPETARQARVQN